MTKQAIRLLLFLFLSNVPFQASAEMLYKRASFCVNKPSTGSTTSSTVSKTPLNSDISISKESTNETRIYIPNSKLLADSGKSRMKACGGGSMAMMAFIGERPPSSSTATVLAVFTPDFFILEISITGDGSGIVTTPEGNSYSSAECSSESCEESYPLILWESDVKKGSRSNATRDSASSDSSVEIKVKAEPNPDSNLRDLICDKPQQERKVIDGQTKDAIVVHCTAKFQLKLLEMTVPLTSTARGKDGNFGDTVATFLGSVASSTELKKDDANMILLHSATDVKITGTITVEPLHVGQLTDMLAVVAFAPGGFDRDKLFYMRDGKQFKPWDGNMATLSALQANVSSGKEQTLEIYQGSLLDGWYEVYLGYRLEEGTIIFNSEPLRIQMNSNP